MYFNPSREQFLKNFYGNHFNRELANPQRHACYHLNVLIQYLKHWEHEQLPAYCTVYDYNGDSIIPIQKPTRSYVYPYADNVILDRIFFDFDLDYNQREKDHIDHCETTDSKKDYILSLIEHGRLKKPIDETLRLSKYITDNFGGQPLLVFSGSKGCHLYLFFEPIILEYPKATIKLFVKSLESCLNLETLDPSPIGDLSRISRIPTSIHPGTGLYAHPFEIDSTYKRIISNAQINQPPFDNFDHKNRQSQIKNILMTIDNEKKKKNEYDRYKSIFKMSHLKTDNEGNGYKTRSKIKNTLIKPHDILNLKVYPCFKNAPYGHSLRLLISCLCLWCGFTPDETSLALKIYSEDGGQYEVDKHLHDTNVIKNLIFKGYPKYVFTCSYMINLGLCLNCKKRFYLKLNLPNEYYKKIGNRELKIYDTKTVGKTF